MNQPAVIGSIVFGPNTGARDRLLAPLHSARAQPTHQDTDGMAAALERALRLIAMAELLGRDPTVDDIQTQLRVSRAVAYRCLAAWRAVYGIATPEGATP